MEQGKTKIAVVVGTRPEAIKMAPVVASLRRSRTLSPVLIATGQHRDLLHSALGAFGLRPDVDLDVMLPDQSPSQVLARVLARLEPALRSERPAAVLVQGDTTTVVATALASYYLQIPVGHVEAGLRTYDHQHPFPEEANRQVVARLARWSFAPTEAARDNLLQEHVAADRVFVTGNTVIDALIGAVSTSDYRCTPGTLLVTLHRRESFGEQLAQILLGVRDFLEQTPSAQVLWPLHPNPAVTAAREAVLGGVPRVACCAPLTYAQFAGALSTCRVVLTDSGGIQEEGPSLGKRVLVARETTERPEGIAAGWTRLIGRSRARICDELLRAFSEPAYDGPIPAPSPYGDGHAAQRITQLLESSLASSGP